MREGDFIGDAEKFEELKTRAPTLERKVKDDVIDAIHDFLEESNEEVLPESELVDLAPDNNNRRNMIVYVAGEVEVVVDMEEFMAMNSVQEVIDAVVEYKRGD